MGFYSREVCSFIHFEKRESETAFVILVKMHCDGGNDFYIYKHDDFVDRIAEVYKADWDKPRKDGSKPQYYCWFNFSEFNDADKERKNNWSLPGFDDHTDEPKGDDPKMEA